MRTKTILLYGVLFSLYCIIMFVIPSTFTPTFWAGVIFTQVSFGYCVIVWLYYFRQEHEQHCRFLKIPVVMLANSYLCLQITVSVLGKFIITMPIWVTIVTSLLLLAFSIINLVSIDNTYEYINEIDSVLSSKTTYLKRLQNKVESVLESQTDDKVKKRLSTLVEDIRYSDPMSDSSLSQLEYEIEEMIHSLSTCNADDYFEYIDEIEKKIYERNSRCRLLKTGR